MARFRGTLQGGRGPASRLGHRTSGLTTNAAGWNGNVTVRLFAHPRTDEDWVTVVLNTNHDNRRLYHGPLDRYQDPRGRIIPINDIDKELDQ